MVNRREISGLIEVCRQRDVNIPRLGNLLSVYCELHDVLEWISVWLVKYVTGDLITKASPRSAREWGTVPDDPRLVAANNLIELHLYIDLAIEWAGKQRNEALLLHLKALKRSIQHAASQLMNLLEDDTTTMEEVQLHLAVARQTSVAYLNLQSMELRLQTADVGDLPIMITIPKSTHSTDKGSITVEGYEPWGKLTRKCGLYLREVHRVKPYAISYAELGKIPGLAGVSTPHKDRVMKFPLMDQLLQVAKGEGSGSRWIGEGPVEFIDGGKIT